MKTIKRVISLVLALAMAVCLSACTGSETGGNEEQAGAETGAWTISDQETEAALPEEVKKAFEKATEGFTGSTLVPVAYIGSQVVAGMNYMILCRATTETKNPVTTYQVVIIYADLEGNAELTSITDFNFTEYTEGEGIEKHEMLAGGWYVPEDACGSDIPKDAAAAFEKAASQACWEWISVDPLAYLGSQVVAGSNYALLCRGKPASEDGTDSILVITVYEDLDGNAELSNVYVLDLTSFNN